jgi:hypothetical protein
VTDRIRCRSSASLSGSQLLVGMRTVVSILAGCYLLVAAGCRREPAQPAAGPDPYRGFLARESAYYIPHPQVGHVHRPHAERRMQWPEHPRGEIVFRTNNLGFREDQDTAPRKPDGTVRIMVLGDSHTDGVVWNSESFPNLLEQRLGPQVEVLSCGSNLGQRSIPLSSLLLSTVGGRRLPLHRQRLHGLGTTSSWSTEGQPRPPGYQETVSRRTGRRCQRPPRRSTRSAASFASHMVDEALS